jgi:hypothetical protein
MKAKGNLASRGAVADGFVNRRSGVQSPHPAPAFPPISAENGPRDRREKRVAPRSAPAQDSAHSVAGTFPLCTATEHRCVALALAFFDIMAAGEIGELTFAAVAACEAERNSRGS